MFLNASLVSGQFYFRSHLCSKLGEKVTFFPLFFWHRFWGELVKIQIICKWFWIVWILLIYHIHLLKSDCLAFIQLAFGSISACYGSCWIPATMGEKFESRIKVGQTPALPCQDSSMAACSLVSVWMAGSGCDPALLSDPKNQGCLLLVLWDQQVSPGVEGSCCLRNLLPHFTSLLCEAPVVASAASSVLQRVLLSTWCPQFCTCSLVE